MTVCATCSRELQPEWKFCITCGTPTGVPQTAAIQIIRTATAVEDAKVSVRSRPAPAPAPGYELGGVATAETHAESNPVSETDALPDLDASANENHDHDHGDGDGTHATPALSGSLGDTAEVLRFEDIPEDDDLAPDGPRAQTSSPAKFNTLAVLALILGCLASPLAAVFGHISLAQIGRTGERGAAIAWAAVVLGYLSLAALLVLGITYFVLNT